MKLEQPRILPTGTLEERVAYLERFIYRLVEELQAVTEQYENKKGG
jgi:hypothetical protein